ncbi:DUF4179 domain-containing protein [Paenibacillus lentus]|uniref:DUF4179 domain-containing protein n=1 Tax=Paenibacillus lentus TaxID=1338368 RepID=A0A3Q8S3N3_9BACL|nr:DUF4179 domain-containing protein [Paenibacillus lentus]AZK45232.1 DUF4179 domain-containing protein [Paenibacillus lentus]
MKKVYKVMTTAALASLILGGAALGTATANVSNPTLPAPKSVAAQTSAQNPSVTHNGITLSVSKALYDGNYIGITVNRSGGGLTSGITEGNFDAQAEDYAFAKGAIKDIQIFMNGKNIYDMGDGKLHKRPSLGWAQGSNPDVAEIKIVDPTWLGDHLNELAFSNQFKLTVKITLEGVDKPYTLEMPMQQSVEKATALKPNMTKKHGNLSVTLSKLNLTSDSSRIQLIEKGLDKDKHSGIIYEFVDDEGNIIEQISGFGTNDNNNNGHWYHNFVIDALSKNTESITVKAFTPEMETPGATSGSFKRDENGNLIKNYIKNLEMTVKVKK